MNLTILNKSFVKVAIVDFIDSIIWTEYYNKAGNFELYTKMNVSLLAIFQEDYMIQIAESDRTMIIESIQIKTDELDGEDKLIIKGRSLESVMDRRIILKQILIDSSVQIGIQAILDRNIISGEFSQRNFPNFIFQTSVDPAVTTIPLKAQYYTEYVLDTIQKICSESGVGFKLVLNSSNQMVFSLYAGKDRSYSQIINPHVVFSPDFENLISSDYVQTKAFRKNWAFIAGEEGLASWNQGYYGRWAQIDTFDSEGGDGLALREIFVNAQNLSKLDYDTSLEISDTDYVNQLKQLGYEELAARIRYQNFDGVVDLTQTYKYKTDFFLGDLIQLKDKYGLSNRVRVSGITFSEDLSGSNIYPILDSM
jgi:hypothetical protein